MDHLAGRGLDGGARPHRPGGRGAGGGGLAYDPFTLSLPLWWWAAPEGSTSAIITLDSWPKALTMPFVQGALDLFILLWLVPRLVRWQARPAAALLGPTGRTSLAERVEELTETRAEALEAHGAELRRIERDLHDGTQAQLVAAALRLGLADRRYRTDPDAARDLFLEARDGIEEALTQLRTVIRGIYPPILSDRGLAGCARSPPGSRSRSRWTSRTGGRPPPSRPPPTSSSPRPSPTSPSTAAPGTAGWYCGANRPAW